jgi:hypothetical protein
MVSIEWMFQGWLMLTNGMLTKSYNGMLTIGCSQWDTTNGMLTIGMLTEWHSYNGVPAVGFAQWGAHSITSPRIAITSNTVLWHWLSMHSWWCG